MQLFKHIRRDTRERQGEGGIGGVERNNQIEFPFQFMRSCPKRVASFVLPLIVQDDGKQ